MIEGKAKKGVESWAWVINHGLALMKLSHYRTVMYNTMALPPPYNSYCCFGLGRI